jgi:amino acid transporter
MLNKAFFIFLCVSLAVAAVIVLVYAKKHPNPYFRPKKGEVFMMSIFMSVLAVIASFIASQAFTDFDPEKSQQEKDQEKNRAGYQGAGGSTSDSSDGGSSTSKPATKEDKTVPPFLEKK